MNVVLKDNYGYTWTHSGSVYFKGYLTLGKNNKVFKGIDAVDFLEKIDTEEALKNVLTDSGGIFCFVINSPKFRCAAVDISRSFPIFFDRRMTMISDSAEEIRKSVGIKKEDVDDYEMSMLMAGNFLFGNETVYKSIEQLDLGQYIIIEAKVSQVNIHSSRDYFIHLI